jgi:predicted dehydrogenase
MNLEKLRIGVLGCSSFAKRSLIPNILSSSQFELAGVASRTQNGANEFGDKFNCLGFEGYDKLINFEGVDIIYLPLPVALHKKWILAALAAGKHVLVEKSFTESIVDTVEVLDMARRVNKCVFENFMFPFHNQITFVREQLLAGKIGELRQLKSSFAFPIFDNETNIRYRKELGGGALLDAGAYTTLAAQLFLGNELSVVGSVMNNCGREVDFNCSAILVNKNGLSALLSFGFDHFYQNSIELWGTMGRIVMKRAFTAGPGIKPIIEIETKDGTEKIDNIEDNHLHKMFEVFFKACKENPYYQFHQILNQSRILSEINENAKRY